MIVAELKKIVDEAVKVNPDAKVCVDFDPFPLEIAEFEKGNDSLFVLGA